ncbi:hypothetical protein [Alloalcanivorax marinus]|uniref:hypothetical protein n=1 Tax=Alloalcanivorax marinus TaxID=1177169 RepID=UPI0019311C2E|nr:hypothetical protein [Alloalcanivorax marinus]MBL7251451.1 hypothetical protein [Alloalcanivorax marinus]
MEIVRRASFGLLWVMVFLIGCAERTSEEKLQALEEKQKEYQARIDGISDEEARRTLTHLNDMVFWVERSELEQKVPPEQVEYEPSAFTILDDYENPRDMAEQWAAGLLLVSDLRYRPAETRVLPPFEYPFESRLEWQSVTLKDGTALSVVERDPFADQTGLAPMVLWNSAFERLETQLERHRNLPIGQVPPKPAPVVRARGKLTLKMPEALPTLAFTAAEVGETKAVADWRFTLKEIDGHQARLIVGLPKDFDQESVDAVLDSMVAEASDESGRFLSRSGSSQGPEGSEGSMLEVLETLIETAEAGELDDEDMLERVVREQRNLLDEDHPELYYEVAFRGTPSRIQLRIPGLAKESVLTVPLDMAPVQFEVPDNLNEPKPFGVTARVYDHDASDWLLNQPLEARPDELASLITPTFVAGEDIGTPGFEVTDKVYFHFPDRMSNRLVSTFERFDEVNALALLDESGKVLYEYDPDDRDAPLKFTVDRVEYQPGRFDGPPATLRGEIDITLYTNINVSDYSIDALPEGYEMHGPVLFGPSAADNQVPDLVLAYDAQENYLKKITTVRHGFDEGWSRRAYHFYGTPAGFVFVSRGTGQKVPYAFQVSLQE